MQSNEKITKVTPLLINTNATGYSYINYPNLDSEAQRITHANFNKFVSAHNENAKELDKEIDKYNVNLVKCNENELKAAKYFLKSRLSGISVTEYNQDVEDFNNMYKKILVPKKRTKRITSGHINAFKAIVSFQAGQLKAHCNFKLKMGSSTKIDRNQISFTAASHELANAKDQYGSFIYPVHKKTVQNHLKRLDELEVLNVIFQGSNNPYLIRISSKILMITDGNPPKQQNSENQTLIPPKEKNLRDRDITTRTKYYKEIKSIDNFIDTQFKEKQVSHIALPAESYKTTSGISIAKENSPGAKNREKILKNFIEPKEFAEKLANNEFVNYNPATKTYWNKLYKNPLITEEEFRQLFIQEIFKRSNAIWKNHNKFKNYDHSATVGSYLIAMREFNSKFLKDKASNRAFSKVNQLERMEEYFWRIGMAKQNFAKKDKETNEIKYFARFPHIYFDPFRKSKQDVCFYGTSYAWNAHITKKIANKKLTDTQKQAEKQRIEIRKINDRYNKIIYKYLNRHISLEQLYNYVSNNFPSNFAEALPINIEALRVKIYGKAA